LSSAALSVTASTRSALTRPTYRADIDGLRAVAVLSVVAYHAFGGKATGGFVGVDIFFVISGFLISTILFENLERRTFSFAEFYRRRIRRIFPALVVVLVATLALGWVLLLDDEFRKLSKDVAGGAAFVSNILLWNESGYFDTEAAKKPLLHLWSLGVEEQFYIAWPLLLYIGWRLRANLLVLTIVVAAASFVFNIAWRHIDPVGTFYSPLSRFWELLAGATLAYLTLKQPALGTLKGGSTHVASVIGAVLIIGACLFLRADLLFPGWWALLPIAGAYLLIAAGPDAAVNRVVLRNRVVVWLGLISYPLYLWHWPLLAYLHIVFGEPSRTSKIVAIGLSVVLAFLTYKAIEVPLRFKKTSATATAGLAAAMLVLALFGYRFYELQSLPVRAISHLNPVTLASGNDGFDGGVSVNECGLSDKDKALFAACKRDSRQAPSYGLIGDSKAGAMYAGLVRTSRPDGRWLFIGGVVDRNGAYHSPLVVSRNKIYANNQPNTEIAIKALNDNRAIEKVVLVVATRELFALKTDFSIDDLPSSKNYVAALEGLENTVALLTKANKKVVILTDNPSLPYPEDCLRRVTGVGFIDKITDAYQTKSQCRLELGRHLQLTEQYRMLLEQVQSEFPESVRIFDTTRYLCDLEESVCLADKNGRALYQFTDHVSDYAAGLIGKDLNEFLRSY
jgi:peptidoglycan/LPS O-acetylase OafA/YrhL